MSENRQHFETGIVINDKPQGTVARNLSCYSIFTDNVLQIHRWVCLWKYLRSVNIWRNYRQESWLSRAPCAMGTVPCAQRWRTRQISEYGKKQLLLTVVTSISTWLRQSANWCRPILTCQLTPSETVAERWWCAKGFAAKPFFLCCCSCRPTVSYSVTVSCSMNISPSSVN